MVFTRSPSLITEKLRNIINRDTIIIISIVGPIAAFFDIVAEPTLTQSDKIITYILIILFILVGVIRLIKGSIFDRKPIYAIILYILILIPATAYFADVRSFYIFFWIIPFYLASFYYGKSMVYTLFAVLGATQITKMLLFSYFGYITRFEDYLYMISEFFIVVALTLLVMDTTDVSEEDRVLLYNSLETAEVEQKRLKALINSMKDGVVAIDDEFKIVTYNAAALNILDKHDDIKGKDMRKILYVKHLDESPLTLETLLNSATEQECVITYADGQKATLSISGMYIDQRTNKSDRGSLLVFRDITKQKSLQEERNAFISLMSHELRTPLTIAEASASNALVILQNDDKQKAKTAIEDIATSIAQLTDIVNDFSLVVDSTMQQLALKRQSVDLQEFCRLITDKYGQKAHTKSLDLNVYVAPNTTQVIYTDLHYFEHIVQSFIENALKFTDSGTITVHFSEQAGYLVVTVEDTGIGIAKSDQSKVFSPFYQGADYETRSYGGLGIGLYTSKKLADILGAKLDFSSEKDHGSVFNCRIPLHLLTNPQDNNQDQK